jgi:hypothetical protein
VVSLVRRGTTNDEAAAWRALWAPLVPAWTIVIAIASWSFVDPDDDEALHAWAVLLAVAVAAVWVRAIVRAARSARPHGAGLVYTAGLVRPRVHVAPGVRELLDADALAAAVAHEEAHAAHWDPLRMWLAQLATDLQWPLPGARRRADDWLRALEVARDDEARRAGARGADLASAILTVARSTRLPVPACIASLTGQADHLRRRIQRLMEDQPIAPIRRRSWLRPAFILTLGAVLGVAVGVLAGESVMEALSRLGT